VKKKKKGKQKGQLNTRVHWQPAGDRHLIFICILRNYSCCQGYSVDLPYLQPL